MRLSGLKVSDEQFIQTTYAVGIAIDTGQDWIAVLIDRVAKLGGTSNAEAKERILKHAAFTDSLVFTQLGNPELIVGYDPAKQPRGQDSIEIG